MYSVKGLERKLQQGVKEGKVARKGLLVDRLAQAEQAGVLSADEVASILAAENCVAVRFRSIISAMISRKSIPIRPPNLS